MKRKSLFKRAKVAKSLMWVAACAFGTVGSIAETTVTFELLGDLPGGDFTSSAAAVSADGSVVVGHTSSQEGPEAFRWENGTMSGLGFLPDGSNSFAYGISDDGNVVVGVGQSSSSDQAFRWEDGTMTGLGFLPDGETSGARDVSADGTVIVGYAYTPSGQQAFRWENGLMTGLGYLPGGDVSYASSVSADGSVVVGIASTSSGDQAFRWENGLMTGLGFLPDGDYSAASGVSADGTVLVGAAVGSSGFVAFRWEGGTMTSLSFLPRGVASRADGVSADGAVVFGMVERNSSPIAVYWSEDDGWQPVSLNEFLDSAGVDRNGYSLHIASAISADGTTIVGSGMHPNGDTEAFRVRIVEQASPILEILQPPQSYTAAPGSTATFTVATGGIEGESFEWKHGDTVVGGDIATLSLSNVQASDAGQYTVTVTAGEDSVSSRSVTLGVKAPPYTEKMMNISTRGQVLTGAKIMIAGFVLQGTGSKDVLIRGIGPTLGSFGVPGTITDPMLELFRSTDPNTAFSENDDWGTASGDIAAAHQRVGAFALGDGTKDAAIYMTLDPGAFTAQVSGMDGTGVGLVELYDADQDPTSSTCTMVNISTRGEVGVDSEILIAGFVIDGEVPKQVLVRGIGPRLADFGVDGTLTDPYLRILKNVETDQLWVASNDNWSDNPNAAEIVSTSTAVGAFGLTDGSNDAVILTWLEPGVYTAQVSGVDNTTGVALVEVYEVK